MTARSEGARPKGIFYCSVLFQRSGDLICVLFMYHRGLNSLGEVKTYHKIYFILYIKNGLKSLSCTITVGNLFFKEVSYDHQGCIYVLCFIILILF